MTSDFNGMRKVRSPELFSMIAYATVPEVMRAINADAPVKESNCETCKYVKGYEGGHCYLFRTKPEDVCGQYRPVDKPPTVEV